MSSENGGMSEVKMERKTITSWNIHVDWSDGKDEVLADMPDDVSQSVDDWLSSVEEERNEQEDMLSKVGAEDNDEEVEEVAIYNDEDDDENDI